MLSCAASCFGQIFIVTYAKSFPAVSLATRRPEASYERVKTAFGTQDTPKAKFCVMTHMPPHDILCAAEKCYKLCRISCFTTRNLDCKSLVLYSMHKMLQVIAVKECWMYWMDLAHQQNIDRNLPSIACSIIKAITGKKPWDIQHVCTETYKL